MEMIARGIEKRLWHRIRHIRQNISAGYNNTFTSRSASGVHSTSSSSHQTQIFQSSSQPDSSNPFSIQFPMHHPVICLPACPPPSANQLIILISSPPPHLPDAVAPTAPIPNPSPFPRLTLHRLGLSTSAAAILTPARSFPLPPIPFWGFSPPVLQGGKVRWVGVVMVTVQDEGAAAVEVEVWADLEELAAACQDEEPEALSRLWRMWARRDGVRVVIFVSGCLVLFEVEGCCGYCRC